MLLKPSQSSFRHSALPLGKLVLDKDPGVRHHVTAARRLETVAHRKRGRGRRIGGELDRRVRDRPGQLHPRRIAVDPGLAVVERDKADLGRRRAGLELEVAVVGIDEPRIGHDRSGVLAGGLPLGQRHALEGHRPAPGLPVEVALELDVGVLPLAVKQGVGLPVDEVVAEGEREVLLHP